jgi:hypothetical protein
MKTTTGVSRIVDPINLINPKPHKNRLNAIRNGALLVFSNHVPVCSSFVPYYLFYLENRGLPLFMSAAGRLLRRGQHVEADAHPVSVASVDLDPVFQPAREYVHPALFRAHTLPISSEIGLLANGVG